MFYVKFYHLVYLINLSRYIHLKLYLIFNLMHMIYYCKDIMHINFIYLTILNFYF